MERPIKPVLNGHVSAPYGVRGVWWGWHRNNVTGLWVKGQRDGLGEHTGYDFVVPVGTLCLAVHDGTITYLDENPKLGLFLILRLSDGTTVTYCHLSKILIVEGGVVKRGDVIALSGATGNVTGPHLHISFREPKTLQWFAVDFL